MLDAAGISSLRRLAEVTSLSPSAVARLVHGDSTPNPETVTAVATALRVPESSIYQLTHGHDIEVRKWEPPAEVNRLSKRSQDAITEMIRALVAEQEQREDVMGNARSTAPISQAEDTSANPEDYDLAAFEPDEREHGITPGAVGDDAP